MIIYDVMVKKGKFFCFLFITKPDQKLRCHFLKTKTKAMEEKIKKRNGENRNIENRL